MDDLSRLYRRVCLVTHPDRTGGSKEMFGRVREAYEFLEGVYGRTGRFSCEGGCGAWDLDEAVAGIVRMMKLGNVKGLGLAGARLARVAVSGGGSERMRRIKERKRKAGAAWGKTKLDWSSYTKIVY